MLGFPVVPVVVCGPGIWDSCKVARSRSTPAQLCNSRGPRLSVFRGRIGPADFPFICLVCVCVLFYYTPFSSVARGVPYILHRTSYYVKGLIVNSSTQQNYKQNSAWEDRKGIEEKDRRKREEKGSRETVTGGSAAGAVRGLLLVDGASQRVGGGVVLRAPKGVGESGCEWFLECASVCLVWFGVSLPRSKILGKHPDSRDPGPQGRSNPAI